MFLQDEVEDHFADEQAHLAERHEQIRQVFALCGSPAEAQLLLFFLRQESNAGCFLKDRPYMSFNGFMDPIVYGCNLHVYPQYDLSKSKITPRRSDSYHVDFLFEIIYWDNEAGKWQVLGRLIVELDGEEDEGLEPVPSTPSMSRERQISVVGLPLLRFSPQEVCLAVSDVWVEIHGHLSSMVFETLRSDAEREVFSHR